MTTADTQAAAPDMSAEAAAMNDLSKKADALAAEAKKSLEWEIAGRDVRVTVAGRRLVLRRWGLRNQMTLAGRVMSLAQRVQSALPAGTEPSFIVIAHVIGALADDIMEIVAMSMVEPFDSIDAAITWMDEECGYEDLLNLGMVVYDQNLKEGGLLGKVQSLEKVAEKIQSLST